MNNTLETSGTTPEQTSFGLSRPTAWDRASAILRRYVMEIVLLVICVVMAFLSPYFLTIDNLLNVLRVNSFYGIIALGMTMVIIAGEIDLSVGSAMAFAGCLCAYIVRTLSDGPNPMSPGLAVTLGMIGPLLLLPLIGVMTGVLRTRFRVPTFITTLALLTILRGVSKLLVGTTIAPFPGWYDWFGAGSLAGIPVPALLFVVMYVLVQFLMSYTSFGRSVYAVGGNAEAARLSGINVEFVKVAVMTLVALLAGVSGLMMSSQAMSGSSETGTGWELDVISAVIIGGTSLMGGSGTIWGTLLGVMFLGVVVNGMTLLNVDEYWKMVVRGSLILIAVLINVGPANRK